MSPNTHAQRGFITVLITFVFATGCAMLAGIPDLDTPDGRVYAQRCGACHGMPHVGGHGIPDPRLRTMAEWETIVPKMEQLIREKGLTLLQGSERQAILRYLSQHTKS
jgi:mono/diheme cytochrome c family protein